MREREWERNLLWAVTLVALCAFSVYAGYKRGLAVGSLRIARIGNMGPSTKGEDSDARVKIAFAYRCLPVNPNPYVEFCATQYHTPQGETLIYMRDKRTGTREIIAVKGYAGIDGVR